MLVLFGCHGSDTRRIRLAGADGKLHYESYTATGEVTEAESKARTRRSPPTSPAEAGPSREPPTNKPGRGGSQHKHLQALIKKLAQDRGYAVTLEKTVLDGHGYVDALLERGPLRIGCEISVTTRTDHEVGNVGSRSSAGTPSIDLVLSSTFADNLSGLTACRCEIQTCDLLRRLAKALCRRAR